MSGYAAPAVHPFFTRTNDQQNCIHGGQGFANTAGDSNINEAPPTEDESLSVNGVSDAKSNIEDRKRTSKQTSRGSGTAKGQRTLSEVLKCQAHNDTIEAHDATLESSAPALSDEDISSNSDRRKRRRASLEHSVDVREDQDSGRVSASSPKALDANVEQDQRASSPHVLVPSSSPVSKTAPKETNDEAETDVHSPAAPKTPPKKMLKLNASGKFGSPMSRPEKGLVDQAAEPPPKKRGRPRKSKDSEHPKQLIVSIRYADMVTSTDRCMIGLKIEDILSGKSTVKLPQISPKRVRTPRKPAKPTHPFFVGKPQAAPPPKQEIPRRTAAITPGKLRAQARHDRSEITNEAAFAVGSNLLKDRLMVKHPGASEPPFPPKGMVHVREDLDRDAPYLRLVLRDRKRKHANMPIRKRESLLTSFAQHLEVEPQGRTRSDGFREAHPSLRVPQRLLLCGPAIASAVAEEVCAPLESGPLDELARPDWIGSEVHPALARLYTALPHYLTPFDELRGENSPWTQRYAPEVAEDVLQPGKDMAVLRSWLQSLTVNAVDVVATGPPKAAMTQILKPKKKRKARSDELDDFIVSEDEDVRSMSAMSDMNDATVSQPTRSIVQSHVEGVKFSNAVLLSGPHGCGKTAAVHAVAKELKFRVFEISSAERRSGKDVLDKVGDVVGNHIVKNHGGTDGAETSAGEEPRRVDAAFQRDLESGRQGTMGAFFKTRPAKKAAQVMKRAGVSAKAKSNVLEAVQNAVKKPAKEQQQSLILLDEVDVLFKEDKEFWNTVFRLIASSKRPFILTCNDEDLVPSQALSLHAILRFSPPPIDLAADYLLLISAKEGHLLKRQSVLQLWEDSGHDLRKSITTLDFWCRMGVGDVRAGLEWIFQRWPPDSDLDHRGRKLRVVSQGTYQSGMGITAPQSDLAERMKMAGAEFQVSPSTFLGWDHVNVAGLSVPSGDLHPQRVTNKTASLKRFESFADALSATDVYTRPREMDPTLPDLPDKRRTQYIEGLPLLESNEATDFTRLSTELSIAATLSAYRAHQPSHLHSKIDHHRPAQRRAQLSRKDFAALDPLANPISSSQAGSLDTSILDGPLGPIATDVAPYVRQIVRHDLALEQQRHAMLGPNKRARTTRAARSALEGGQRQLTRRARWWEGVGDLRGVLDTAGVGWEDLSGGGVAVDDDDDVDLDVDVDASEANASVVSAE